jgi:hypothetical protein
VPFAKINDTSCRQPSGAERRERPRGCRAAEQRDEFAPPHVET